MAPTALPTLSEVRAFTGDYLVDAAEHWSERVNTWNETFDRLGQHVVRPAGSDWAGAAAESAASRFSTDGRRVTRAADDLAAAARAARRAADELRAATTRLLDTVRAAEAAGLEVGEDFSLSTVESTTSAAQLAAREAQMRRFGTVIRSDVYALIKADENAAAEITDAATGLRSLKFGDDTSDRTTIQAVDFRGVPMPEKPPYLPPVPPAEGWSEDPLMRAAQKIAYGHAWDEHRTEFPGIDTKAQFAEFIRQKMQRAITDPRGLRLGLTEDRVPVIYDPEDNVLIIRDTRPDTTQAGTAFKPEPIRPNYVAKKAPNEVRIFTPEDLVDGAQAPNSSPQTKQGSAEVPRHIDRDDVGESSPRGTFPGWGTHISPDKAAKTDGALGILGRILLGQSLPDPRNPNSWS